MKISRQSWLGQLIDRMLDYEDSRWLRTASYPTSLIQNYHMQTGAANPDPSGAHGRMYEQVSWLFAGTFKRTSFAAMVPFKVYAVPKGKSLDDKEEVPYDHPAYELLRHVNSREVNYTLKEKMVGYRTLAGACFLLKIDGRTPYVGPPTELWVVRPDRVETIKLDEQNQIESFKLRGVTEPVPAKQMIYMPSFHPYDEVWSQSQVRAIERSCVAETTAQDFNINFLKQGGIPMTLFKGKPGFNPAPGSPQERRLLSTWDKIMRQAWKGKRNAAILPADIELLVTQQSHKDMMWPDLRKMSRQEIFGALGVNDAIMGLETPDRSRHESARKEFAQNTMVPELTVISQYWTAQWLSEYLGENLHGEFDFTTVPALQEDETAKMDRAVKAVVNRLMSPNRAAQKYLGEEGYKGGDVIYIPMNMIALGSDGALVPVPDKGKQSRTRAIDYTEGQTRRLQMYHRRLTATETQARKWIEDMFDAQEDAVLKAYRRSASGPTDNRHLDDIVEASMLGETATPYMQRVIVAAIEQGIEHGAIPGIEFDFSLGTNVKLKTWLEAHTLEAVTWVNDKTVGMLEIARVDIVKLASEGATTKQIEDRLREVFDTSRKGRAGTIARTEVQHGIQNTQEMCWKESDVVEGKLWLESFSGFERHMGMHNQTVGLNEDFVLPDGTATPYPGGSGIAEQDINCMCDMAPKVNKHAAMEASCDRLEAKLYPLASAGEGTKRWLRKKRTSELMTQP